jgi:hypothetical protein
MIRRPVRLGPCSNYADRSGESSDGPQQAGTTASAVVRQWRRDYHVMLPSRSAKESQRDRSRG